MKKLTRPQEPSSLSKLVGGRDDWRAADKDEIWLAIDEMQQGFCAYCECRLTKKHIEHFRTRNSHHQLTFSWDNIFGSCGDPTKPGHWPRCGIFKDSAGVKYNPDDLIKPDVDEPDEYFLFLTSGVVRPRDSLSADRKKKAEETIRVFNLNNDSRLLNSRRITIECELSVVESFYSDVDDVPIDKRDEWNELLKEILSEFEGKEFSTALKHIWLYNEKY